MSLAFMLILKEVSHEKTLFIFQKMAQIHWYWDIHYSHLDEYFWNSFES